MAPPPLHRPPTSARVSPPDSPVIPTRRKLADGREILYFDAGPGVSRTATDTRELPQTTTHSQRRFDPLLGEWVVIASHRQTRTFLPPADLCPLCPSTPERATEIPESGYEVVVFENRFPSLSIDREDPYGVDTVPNAELSGSVGTTVAGSPLTPRRARIGPREEVW